MVFTALHAGRRGRTGLAARAERPVDDRELDVDPDRRSASSCTRWSTRWCRCPSSRSSTWPGSSAPHCCCGSPCRQWWAARDGGPDAVRRAGVVLLAVAVLSPATLPWYVSWGMALVAAAPWTRPKLVVAVFVSLMLVIVYYPSGEDALYNFPYLFGCGLLALLAAVSLVHPDPLHLRARPRRSPTRTRCGRPDPAPAAPVPSPGPAELDAAGITDPGAAGRLHRLPGAQRRGTAGPTSWPPGCCRRPAGPRCTPSTASPATPTRSSTTSGDDRPPPRRPPGSTRWTRSWTRALGGAPTRSPGAGRAGRHRPPLRIEPRHFADFMASMRMDTHVTDYPTFAELGVYMHGSAAVIGLQMLPVLGTVGPRADAEPHAAALGVAFQLTNFLRDVGEDLDRGRVYLPADVLAAFGVDRELLLAAAATGGRRPGPPGAGPPGRAHPGGLPARRTGHAACSSRPRSLRALRLRPLPGHPRARSRRPTTTCCTAGSRCRMRRRIAVAGPGLAARRPSAPASGSERHGLRAALDLAVPAGAQRRDRRARQRVLLGEQPAQDVRCRSSRRRAAR